MTKGKKIVAKRKSKSQQITMDDYQVNFDDRWANTGYQYTSSVPRRRSSNVSVSPVPYVGKSSSNVKRYMKDEDTDMSSRSSKKSSTSSSSSKKELNSMGVQKYKHSKLAGIFEKGVPTKHIYSKSVHHVRTERKVSFTCDTVGYVAACSHPIDVMRNEIMVSLLKCVFQKNGLRIANVENDIGRGFSVSVFGSVDGIKAPVLIISATGGSTLPMSAYTAGLIPDIVNWFQTNRRGKLVYMTVAEFLGTDKFAENQYSLENCELYCYSKTKMKLQNNTLSAGNSLSTNVIGDNPLTGKFYDCTGPCPLPANFEGLQITMGKLGTTVVVDPTDVNFTDPPQTSYFRNCVSSGKIYVNPGEIKTKLMIHTYKAKINSFFRSLDMYDNYGTGEIEYTKGIGHSTLIGLTKMIDLHDETADVDVDMEIEQDLKFDVVLKKYVSKTVRKFSLIPALVVNANP